MKWKLIAHRRTQHINIAWNNRFRRIFWWFLATEC